MVLFAGLPMQASALQADDFAGMSLEELANIKVTSVSKKAENLSDAAASVFVITAEDIRRSGATNIPDALRLAPNLQVAQVSASGYEITSRGFNGSNNSAPNKLLVLIDGRSVYTPLFSGVFWDVQDVMIEDVERIEVISGPGGTLWGMNAVNGVINVITRSSKDTQGNLVSAGGGNHEANAALRYGGKFGADGSYRVYGKYLDRRHTSLENGAPVNDAWHRSQAGFRADWGRPGDRLTVQGNAYKGNEAQPQPGSLSLSDLQLDLGDISVSGANLTAGWQHLLDGGSSLNLQAYYDESKRTIPPLFGQKLDIVDLQMQHSLPAIGMHNLIWGANYRYSRDHVDNTSPYIAFLPVNADQSWKSLFAQDEMVLRDGLRLIIGAREEHNDYTGNEFLPSARLAWKLTADHMVWAAASRTVRGPSRLDADIYVPRDPPFLLDGGPMVRSETANVYELGYRGRPSAQLSYSATIFHTVYDHLRTQEVDPSQTFVVFANEMEGSTSGIEMWGTYQVLPSWRLSAGFTALREHLRLKPGSNDIAAPDAAGNDPSNTWQLRSTMNIARNGDLDLTVRHVAELEHFPVPAYTAFDARFGWQLQPGLELSVTGQNLFGSGHAEYGVLAYRSRIPSRVFVNLVWHG